MATHSSVLAWRIPGMGEPGGLAVYGVAQSWTRLKRLSRSSSRLVIAFLPRINHLLISWLQSPPAVILEPPKIKSVTAVVRSPCYFISSPLRANYVEHLFICLFVFG